MILSLLKNNAEQYFSSRGLMTNLHNSSSLSSITLAPTAWKDTSYHLLVHYTQDLLCQST